MPKSANKLSPLFGKAAVYRLYGIGYEPLLPWLEKASEEVLITHLLRGWRILLHDMCVLRASDLLDMQLMLPIPMFFVRASANAVKCGIVALCVDDIPLVIIAYL